MRNLSDILHIKDLTAKLQGVLPAAAVKGYLQGASAFDKGRPDYPRELDDWLTDIMGIKPHSKWDPPHTTVLDLGSGTGKFIPRLVDIGAEVFAVEPVAAMREQLERNWGNESYVKILEGAAEEIPLKSESVDAVICAHSFHWFDKPEAMKEIHRVLKRGGRLGLIWNLRDTREDWVRQVADVVSSVAGDSPRFYSQNWRKMFPYHGFAYPLVERHFTHTHTGTPEDVILNRIRSISFVSTLSEEQQAPIFAQVREIIATHPDLKDKDIITVPYDTVAFHTVKIL